MVEMVIVNDYLRQSGSNCMSSFTVRDQGFSFANKGKIEQKIRHKQYSKHSSYVNDSEKYVVKYQILQCARTQGSFCNDAFVIAILELLHFHIWQWKRRQYYVGHVISTSLA